MGICFSPLLSWVLIYSVWFEVAGLLMVHGLPVFLENFMKKKSAFLWSFICSGIWIKKSLFCISKWRLQRFVAVIPTGGAETDYNRRWVCSTAIHYSREITHSHSVASQLLCRGASQNLPLPTSTGSCSTNLLPSASTYKGRKAACVCVRWGRGGGMNEVVVVS